MAYFHHHLPATGTAVGILVGVEQDVFEVISWSHFNFSVSCELKHKALGHVFRVIVVYGSSYEEGKAAFIF